MEPDFHLGQLLGSTTEIVKQHGARLSAVEAELKLLRRIGILAVLSQSGVSAILRNDVLADVAEKILHALIK